MDLPQHLIESAWGDRDRGYAWDRRHVVVAVEWLRQAGYAILGGDVWVVSEDGKLQLENPRTGENRRGWCWGAPSCAEGEPWEEFVERCAKHTLSWISDVDPDGKFAIESSETVIYEPTWVSEDRHRELQSKRGA